MYSYTWDTETGGLLLNSSPLQFSKEPRPVYSRELDLLGFDKLGWIYDRDDSLPLLWAEANNYIYRGRHVATVKGGTFFTKPTIIIVDVPEPNGGKLKPVNLPLMIEKNAELLKALVTDTIKSVYNTYLAYKEKVDVFHVSYSGGKDSEVTLDIVQRALPHNAFVVIFGDTGMEFSDTYKSVELTRERCNNEGIKFYIARSHLKPTDSWRRFGPPSATIRWCCSVHKTTPQLLLVRDIVGKPIFTEMAFVGVRADESVRRSGYDYISFGTKHRGQYSCNPILTWNSAEVYLYIFANDLHLNDAYKRGNTRAGCLVCPMSTNRNDYLNAVCYSNETQNLIDIIRELNSSDKGNEARIRSYIENNGWKARKNGRDLSISPKDYDEAVINDKLVIVFKNNKNNFFQWIKTIGIITYKQNNDVIEVVCSGASYLVHLKQLSDDYLQVATLFDNSPATTLFMKNLRIICRKSHYCVSCNVCTANCKFGNLHFREDGVLSIKDTCVKCGQCLDIDTGCLVYKSLWLSKGLGNMNTKAKSIDCYAAHGPKIEWFQQYVKLGERFRSDNSLGNAQVPMFNRFLRDAGITENDSETILGKMLRDTNLEDDTIWALMLVNLAFTPEVGWFIQNFGFNEIFGQSSITNKLSMTEGVSNSAQKSIPAALKRISLLPLNKLGFGFSEKSNKQDGGTKFCRSPWATPDPRVILYSLYKFSEACGGYYQFTLSRLYDRNAEGDGVTPYQIFGISEDDMRTIITGLHANYRDFISATFTHDLDNINLKEDKTSQDVFNLFLK